jgi:hypothetical protein
MAAARAIITATRLGVVASLAGEPATADAVARGLRLELAGVEALLTALMTLGYLEVGGRQVPADGCGAAARP